MSRVEAHSSQILQEMFEMNQRNRPNISKTSMSRLERRAQSEGYFLSKHRRQTVLMLVAGMMSIGAASAQEHAIYAAKSSITVRVYKSGVFSAFGHNHEITAPIESGTVNTAAHRVELHIKANSLRVRDPEASEKDRGEIQKTMQSSDVLDIQRYPEISFRSTSADPAGTDSWRLRGNLTLHGQTHPVTVEVKKRGKHYAGSAQFNQTDFAIKPVKFAGGTVRVKDQVRIEFDIQLGG